MSFASDIQATLHNAESVLEGKSTFSEFVGDEGALISAEITKLPAAAQGAVNLMYSSVKAGLSALVGAGETALGPIINETTDQQASQVMNLMQLAGIPTTGPLSIAEHAALVTLINGLKTGLDRAGLHIALTNGVGSAPTSNGSSGGGGAGGTIVLTPQS